MAIMIALAASMAGGCGDATADASKVKEGFKDAWVKSKPRKAAGAITGKEHEEGGWIVKDSTGAITTYPTTPGTPNPNQPDKATLPERTIYEGEDGKKYADKEGKYEIIGGYHTHPFGGSDVLTHPSDIDKKAADKEKLPEYVISEDGVYKYDPSKKDDPETKDKDERVTQVEDKADTDARNEAAKKAAGK